MSFCTELLCCSVVEPSLCLCVCRESQRISAQNRSLHRDRRNHLTGPRLLRKTCEFMKFCVPPGSVCSSRNQRERSDSSLPVSLTVCVQLLLFSTFCFLLLELMKLLSYFCSASIETQHMNNGCCRNSRNL